MRRGLTVTLIVTAMLGVAVPAGAKGKPPKPEPPPEGQGKSCHELVLNGAVWDEGVYSGGVYQGFIGNSDQHGGVCMDLEPLDGVWTVDWTIDVPPRSDLRGIMMVFSQGWGFSANRYDELEVLDPSDQPQPWTWSTSFVTPDPEAPFVFVAMTDIKRARGDWHIDFTVTAPQP
jgi:hypothetical protein